MLYWDGFIRVFTADDELFIYSCNWNNVCDKEYSFDVENGKEFYGPVIANHDNTVHNVLFVSKGSSSSYFLNYVQVRNRPNGGVKN